MRVLLAGGGTAGHINPALAIAAYIKKMHPLADIRFVGTPGGMESKLVPQAGYEIYPVDIRGFRRQISLYNLGTVGKIITSFSQSDKILDTFKPDVVIGTGGYVSGPVLYRAAKRGIPTAIHEQNSFPGVTTKILSRYVDRVMIAMPDAQERIKAKNGITVTGNPLREEILYCKREAARSELGVDGKKVILSFGGSLGARRLNEAICELMALDIKDTGIYHIHGTGSHGRIPFEQALREKGIDIKAPNLDVREYINDMARCLAAADIVISRCGAITLSELQAQGKPSILIPSPNVTENHQYYNALSLQKRGAAVLIEEKDLTGTLLKQTVDSLLSGDRLAAMSKAASEMAILDANERIYRVIMSLLKKR